ncbi:MAG: sugar transferase [Clostridium sp.]|nr:sugar transferase [Clostridium sp.]
MFLKNWDDLPPKMKNKDVREYYEVLSSKRISLFFKRLFDIVVAVILLIILSPVFLVVGILIKADSKGSVMYRQTRVTQYGRQFKVFKFRTMVDNADKIGSLITTEKDTRVTKIGGPLRKLRLDEIPQLLNIIAGDMTFVGIRPEIPKYVERYTDEMLATLLLPAGVTSEASIRYKDEEYLLSSLEDIDETYLNEVLPRKMGYNLKGIKEFSIFNDIKTMLRTVLIVVKDKEDDNNSVAVFTASKKEIKM